VKRHQFHSEAEQEYADAASYYFQINPELAGRFYDEIERLILEIRKQPERFRLFDPPVRRHFSNVFPYAILYLDQPDRIWIVAAMDMKRRPGYWRERLP
jgi:plasmid stabilization system protein ParE